MSEGADGAASARGEARRGFRRVALVCGVLGLLSFVSTPFALAQPDPEEYSKRLSEGLTQAKAGNVSDALLTYLEVRSKFSGPEVDYSLGRMYHKLHQCVDARTFYAFVMNSYDLDEGDDLYSRSAGYFDELYSCDTWGVVELKCGSPDAMLLIDGEKVGRCLKTSYQMPAGEHTFRLERDGEEPVSATVQVSEGSFEKVSLALPEKVVEKIVESAPPPVVVSSSGPNWLAWGLIGGGGAVLAASAFFNAAGYQAMQDVQKAADAGDFSARKAAEDDVGTHKVLTGITFGVGLAALATGVTLVMIDAFSEPDEAATGVGFVVGNEGAAVVLQGRF